MTTRPHNTLTLWLFLCCFMVFAMAVLGAITRLTESGLSITEWRPISGVLPPLSEAAWRHAFDLYRATPEFPARHAWMTLSDFKGIFFWEWFHRLWGRMIGIAFAGPLLWFYIRKKIPAGYGWKFLGLLALGFAQGFIGWFMVESGLVDRPSVSPYRLALHLDFALLIFAAMLWVGLDLLPSPIGRERDPRSGGGRELTLHGWLSLALLALAITWGAFTANLHGGLVYNTFPLMNGGIFPPEAFHADSLLAQAPWVQFIHRWLAVAAGLAVFIFALRVRFRTLAAMVVIQIGLGIATLLTQVNLPLAVAHQAGAIVLLGLLVAALHDLYSAGKIQAKEGGGGATPPSAGAAA